MKCLDVKAMTMKFDLRPWLRGKSPNSSYLRNSHYNPHPDASDNTQMAFSTLT